MDVSGLVRRICCHSFESVSTLSGPSSPFPLPARRTVREDFPHTALPPDFFLKGYDSSLTGDAVSNLTPRLSRQISDFALRSILRLSSCG